MRWVAVMAHHPDERIEVARFKPEYFQWLENQVFSIQDFPYARIDFRGDPDMVLPPGEQWDESGKILFNIFSILIFCYFFIVSKLIVKISKCRCGSIATSRSLALREEATSCTHASPTG